jgi:anion-transporting  ArsA/GET3 family ATPase
MINKFINRLKLLYYTYKLNRFIDSSIAKDDFVRTNPISGTLGSSFGGSDSHEEQLETDRLYLEALGKIKKTVQSKVKSHTKDEYEAVLKEMKDLSTLAAKNPNAATQILKSIYVHKNQDVVDDKDKKHMIDKRINDYYKLQKFNEEKVLLRSIRKAQNQGDLEAVQNLTQQWKEKYGNKSRSN